MTHFLRLTRDAARPEISRPDPSRVLAGDPVHTTWAVEDDRDGLYCGLWHSTPGTWRVSYAEWEYFHILEGHSVLTETGAAAVSLHPGDSVVLRPGFEGIWQVVEPTLKDYVIRL